jgi:phage tail sheath gpL-like
MTISLPEVTINIVPSYQKTINHAQKVLFVGQMTAAGTATSGQLYTDIDNANGQTALFGAASMLDLGIRAFKSINKNSQVDVIPLADASPAAVAATGSVQFNGTASAGGSFTIQVVDISHQYTVTVGLGDTADDIGTALAALINADVTCAVSAVNTLGDIALTAKVPGSAGNSIVVTVTGSATGISHNEIPMSGGTDGSIAASGSIVFTGAPTANGTYTIDVGSSINNEYTISVTNGETLSAIGAALAAAINADTMSPVTAINTTGSVALTAKNKGLEGNFISLRVKGSVTGVTVAVNVMSGGAINPTITNVFSVITDERYQTIVWPQTYTSSILSSFLESRFNVDNDLLDGEGIIGATDTFANLQTLGNSLNYKTLVYIGDKKIVDTYYKGASILELDYVRASEFAAIRSLRLTEGANISRYVLTTTGLLDNTGGMSIASLPYFNTPFYNLPLIDPQYGFSKDEITQLNTAGITVLANNPDATHIIAGTTISTYKRDAASNSDVTFKYLEYVDTASNVREYFYNNSRSRFAQCRLTAGDVVPQRNMVNPKIISAFFDELYEDLANQYVLTQTGIDQTTGIEFLSYFKANKTVTLDLEVGSATVTMIVPIVTQLRKIFVQMQVGFSTNS